MGWVVLMPEHGHCGVFAARGKKIALERSGVALLGLKLGGGKCGIDLAAELIAEAPGLRCVLSSGAWKPYVVVEAMRHGIHGYHCMQHDDADDLVAAVRAAASGRHSISPSLAAMSVQVIKEMSGTISPLTEREEKVLLGFYRHTPQKAIADALGVADSTVGRDVSAIAKKLGVEADVGPVLRRAIDLGLVNLAARREPNGSGNRCVA